MTLYESRYPRNHKIELIWTGYRVPAHQDLYLDKNGRIQRWKGDNYSRRAQPRNIYREPPVKLRVLRATEPVVRLPDPDR